MWWQSNALEVFSLKIECKTYFSADEKESYILSNKTMFEARSLFMHAHMLTNVDKYMEHYLRPNAS